jgi:multidrug efflux system membrane fusion protein
VDEAGTLSFLDNTVDSLTGSVTAKASFTNRSNALWPGEYVRVMVQLDIQAGAVVVPSQAVLSSQQGNYVFVIDSGGKAAVRPVKIGRSVGSLTTIDKGLAPGEDVVIDGQSRLTPNARVDVKQADK